MIKYQLPKKNTLALFSFVKNENDIIEKFINHHLNIFDEINIIDNGSTDGTYEILEKYKSHIKLIKDHSEFSKKGSICTQIMKNSSCDLLFPLDADELIVYDDSVVKTKNPNKIRKYLQNLPINGQKYNINKIYNQYPDESDFWFVVSNPRKKNIS